MRLYADSAYEKTHDVLAPLTILCFSPSLDLFLTRIIFSYGKCFGFFVFFLIHDLSPHLMETAPNLSHLKRQALVLHIPRPLSFFCHFSVSCT